MGQNEFTSTLPMTCPKCCTELERPGIFSKLGCANCLKQIPAPGGGNPCEA